MSKPGNPAVLSFVLPDHHPGFWVGSGGTLGWICHLAAAYTAYEWARTNPRD